MNEKKMWYAVYTRPGCEEKVAGILTRNKIENYCPLYKVSKQWSDRKKFSLKPLFTSYVFVRVLESEHLILKKTDGIINMVYWLDKPAVINDAEIEMIKNLLGECINIKLEKRPISINDSMRIIYEQVNDFETKAIGLKSKVIKVILPTLGYVILAEVETGNVRVIESENFNYSIKPLADRYIK